MQEPEDLSPAENELEAALRGLHPAPCPIDRDRLMFLAGQASARRAGRPWRLATAGLALAACAAIVSAAIGWLGSGRPAGPGERIVIVRVHEPAPPADQPAPPAGDAQAGLSREAPARPEGLAYLHLRDAVLTRGLDALPAAAHPGSGTTVRQARTPGV